MSGSQHRSFSFYIKRYRDEASGAKQGSLRASTSRTRPDDDDPGFPSSLSRKNSFSSNLLHELKGHALYRQQRDRLEDKKSKSVDCLDLDSIHSQSARDGSSRQVRSKQHQVKPQPWKRIDKRKSLSWADITTQSKELNKKTKMNFFPMSGSANLANPNQRGTSKVSIVTKPLEEAPTEANSLKDVNKYGALSRNLTPKTKDRRKHSFVTRSLWYDVDSDRDEDDAVSSRSNLKKMSSLENLLSIFGKKKTTPQNLRAESIEDITKRSELGKQPAGFGLRKSTSLESLVRTRPARPQKRINLSKDLISSPMNFRKVNIDPPMPEKFDKIEEEKESCEVKENHPMTLRKAASAENLFDRNSYVGFDVTDSVTSTKKSTEMTSDVVEDTNNGVTGQSVEPLVEPKLRRKKSDIYRRTASLERTRKITISKKVERYGSLKKVEAPKVPTSFVITKDDSSSEVVDLKDVVARSDKPGRTVSRISDLSPIGEVEEKHDKIVEEFVSDKTNEEHGSEVVFNEFTDGVELRRKDDCSSGVVLRSSEVLKTLQNNKDDSDGQYYITQKFPLTEQDDAESVQIRRNQNISHYRTSKTTDFDFRRKASRNNPPQQDFEVRGCVKFQLPNDGALVKLKKTEVIKYQNGNIYKCNEDNLLDMTILRPKVILKSARLLNKREVELRDANNLSYILIFDSSKDAKIFVENDKISCYIDNNNKSTVTKTLLRLLGKRSSREVLEKKGIYQNEPIFGNTLKNIFNIEKGVPRFILKTIDLIEKPENIASIGIYRTSGNLATIQKIRYEVDKGRLEVLDDFTKDVDVLTGSLKLFFRELKEPLISCEACDNLLGLTKPDKEHSRKDKEKIKSILNRLPEANLETLKVLIRHLIEVVKYKEQNKMDSYNLAVCWGPTVIFATDLIDSSNSKDLVTQSTEATRLFDNLLVFYDMHPEELDFGNRKQEFFDTNKNKIQRYDSRESVYSSDSNNSRTLRKTVSNTNPDIDEVIKKVIEMIDVNIGVEGLYKKPGSIEKVNKIFKKMTKRKISEIEKHRGDVNELAEALKKYLRAVHEPLVTKQVVEQVNKYCDTMPCLEHNTRQRIISTVRELPKKETLIFLIKHIIKVLDCESSHKVSRSEIISIWTDVLNNQRQVTESSDKFSNFLKILLDVLDGRKSDFNASPKGMTNGLLNDLKNLQRDRTSKYDNVPDEFDNLREATILEEKTDNLEHTKL